MKMSLPKTRATGLKLSAGAGGGSGSRIELGGLCPVTVPANRRQATINANLIVFISPPGIFGVTNILLKCQTRLRLSGTTTCPQKAKSLAGKTPRERQQ